MEGSTSHRPRLSWLSSLLVCLFALPATAGGALAADPTPSLPYARAAYYAGAGAPYDPITRLEFEWRLLPDNFDPSLNVGSALLDISALRDDQIAPLLKDGNLRDDSIERLGVDKAAGRIVDDP